MKHFTTHRLLDQHQSAYRPARPGHSVETAFQVVYSSVSQQLDRGRPVFLVLIDLSAAFDTDSHENLISLLASKFGIGGIVLQWFQSYLSDRSYKVKIGRLTLCLSLLHVRLVSPKAASWDRYCTTVSWPLYPKF